MVIVEYPNKAMRDPREFFLQYIDITSGGFVGGYPHIIKKIREMFYDLVKEIFDTYNIKDDDQFYYTILQQRHPELFHLTLSSWYGSLYFT